MPQTPTLPASDKRAARGELVTSELRDEILRGRFRAGERLPSERDLALRFGVHRGAVREALKKLEQLGLAEIRPGGARVAPLEEASLDVVEHLIELEDPPDPALVDEVLEVFSGLFALAGRLAVERASPEERARAHEILATVADPGLDADARHERMLALGDLFIDASRNLVLQLVRRGLKISQILDGLHERGRGRADSEPALPPEVLARLDRAVTESDGPAAAEAIFELSAVFRRFVVETLQSQRPALADPEAPAFGVLRRVR